VQVEGLHFLHLQNLKNKKGSKKLTKKRREIKISVCVLGKGGGGRANFSFRTGVWHESKKGRKSVTTDYYPREDEGQENDMDGYPGSSFHVKLSTRNDKDYRGKGAEGGRGGLEGNHGVRGGFS